MGNVGHHPESIHFYNDLFAKIRESVVVVYGNFAEVSGRIGPFVGIVGSEQEFVETQ